MAPEGNKILQCTNPVLSLSLCFPCRTCPYSHKRELKAQHSLCLMYCGFKEHIPQLQRVSCSTVIVTPAEPFLAEVASATQHPGEFLMLQGRTEQHYLVCVLPNTLRVTDGLIPLTGICDWDSKQYLFSSWWELTVYTVWRLIVKHEGLTCDHPRSRAILC